MESRAPARAIRADALLHAAARLADDAAIDAVGHGASGGRRRAFGAGEAHAVLEDRVANRRQVVE
jgi:hypothetical protein